MLRRIFRRTGLKKNTINLYGSEHILVDFSELYDEGFAPRERPNYKVVGDDLYDPVSGLHIPLEQLVYKNVEPTDKKFVVTAFDVAIFKKDYGTAISMMDNVLKKNPQNIGAMVNKALILGMGGNSQAAYDLNTVILKKEPNNYFALNNRAIDLIALKRPEEALNDIKKAISSDPQKFIPSYGIMFRALYALGRKEEALDALEAGLNIKKEGALAGIQLKNLSLYTGCDNPEDALKEIIKWRAGLKGENPSVAERDVSKPKSGPGMAPAPAAA